MHGDVEPADTSSDAVRKQTWRWLRYAVPSLLVLLAGGALLLFAHSEPTEVAQGSLGYHLGIPGSVKRLPVRDDCATALYSHQPRDGERIGMARVSYETTSTKAELLSLYSDHFKALGCTAEGSDQRCLDGNVYETRIAAAASGQCQRVDLMILGDFK